MNPESKDIVNGYVDMKSDLFEEDSTLNNGDVDIKSELEEDSTLKLTQLLKSNKFSDAEKIASTIGLDINNIQISHILALLEQLNGLDQNYCQEAVEQNASFLWCLLENTMIDDSVIEALINSSMPSIDLIKQVFAYVHNQLKNLMQTHSCQGNYNSNCHTALFNQLVDSHQRLMTYSKIVGAEHFSSETWNEFRSTDLQEKMLYYFTNQDFHAAFVIWKYHRGNWKLSDGLLDTILSHIPESRGLEFSDWICDEFIPSVFIHDQRVLIGFNKWTTCCVQLMELSKRDWPISALKFVGSIYRSCVSSQESHADWFTEDMSFQAAMASIQNLLKTLERITELHTKYQLSITFSQFTKGDMNSVALYMLENCSSDRILRVLETQILPFITDYRLDSDYLFSEYIYVQKHHIGMSSDEGWDKKLVAVIDSIQSHSMKINSLIEVLTCITPPCSVAMKELIDRCMSLPVERVSELKDLSTWFEVRSIFLKYKKYIYEKTEVERAVYHILKSHNSEAMGDATTVLRFSDLQHMTANIYSYRLQVLIQRDQLEQIPTIMDSIPDDVKIAVCRRMLIVAEDSIENMPKEISIKLLKSSSIFTTILSRLVGDLERSEICSFQDLLQRSLSIQKEFKIAISVTDMLNMNSCKSHLEQFALQNLSSGISVIPSDIIRKLLRLTKLLSLTEVYLCKILVGFYLSVDLLDPIVDLYPEVECDTNHKEWCLYLVDVSLKLIYKLSHPDVDQRYNLQLPIVLKHLASIVCQYCPLDTDAMGNNLPLFLALYHILNLFCQCLDECEARNNYDITMQHKVLMKDMEVIWRNSCVTDMPMLDKSDILEIFPAYITCLVSYYVSLQSGAGVEDKMKNLCDSYNRAIVLFSSSSVSLLFTLIHYASLYSPNININQADQAIKSFQTNFYSKYLQTTQDYLIKQISKLPLDMNSLWSHFLSLPANVSQSTLRRCIHCNVSQPDILIQISLLGKNLAKVIDLNIKTYEILHKEAQWAEKFSKYKVEYRIMTKDKMKFVHDLAKFPEVDLNLIQGFCRYVEHISLESYLDSLLMECSRTADISVRTAQLTQAAQILKRTDHNRDRLCHFITQADTYDYEFIEFLHTQLISSSKNMDETQEILKGVQLKGDITYATKLLECLKVYRRVSPISDVELSMMSKPRELNDSLDVLPSSKASTERLPFHLLLIRPWDVLKAEVNLDNIDVWVPLSEIIQVNLHHICMTAIKNYVDTYTQTFVKESAWTLSSLDIKSMDKMREVMELMTDSHIVIPVISELIEQLHSGLIKIHILEEGIKFLNRLDKDSSIEETMNSLNKITLIKFMNKYRDLSLRRILHSYQLDDSESRSHTDPVSLIRYLFGHPSVSQNFDSLDIYGACNEICRLYELEPSLIYLLIVDEILNVSRPDLNTNFDETLSLSFLHPMEHPVNSSEPESFKISRLIYILKRFSMEDSCMKLLNVLSEQNSAASKLRAINCILTIADEEDIRKNFGFSRYDLLEQRKCFLYLVGLEEYGISHSAESFLNCNKRTLMVTLLSQCDASEGVLQLTVNIGLEYQVTDVHLWHRVLKTLLNTGYRHLLHRTLIRLQRHSPLVDEMLSLPEIWQGLIQSTLIMEDGSQAVSIFYGCPIQTKLDLERLKNKFKQMNQLQAADYCKHLLFQ